MPEPHEHDWVSQWYWDHHAVPRALPTTRFRGWTSTPVYCSECRKTGYRIAEDRAW